MFISPPFKPEVLEESEKAYQILEDVRSETHHLAFIGGGAPRDWYFNGTATDIDIFVPYTDTLDVNTAIDVIESKFGNVIRKTRTNTIKRNPEYSNLIAFIELIINGLKVQIMFVDSEFDTEEKIVDSFPCDLSRIVYKDGMLVPYASFLKIFKTNTVKFSPTCSSIYSIKIKRKFTNYSFNFEKDPKPSDTYLDSLIGMPWFSDPSPRRVPFTSNSTSGIVYNSIFTQPDIFSTDDRRTATQTVSMQESSRATIRHSIPDNGGDF